MAPVSYQIAAARVRSLTERPPAANGLVHAGLLPGRGSGGCPFVHGTSAAVSEPVLRLERRGGGIAHVTLDRPAVRNAFNPELIAALRDTFLVLDADEFVRAVVLRGAGTVFCGGADINWMRESLDLSADDNVRDAERMADMFAAIDRCPKPVIGCIAGAAIGGGAGLAAVCDIVVAAAEARSSASPKQN